MASKKICQHFSSSDIYSKKLVWKEKVKCVWLKKIERLCDENENKDINIHKCMIFSDWLCSLIQIIDYDIFFPRASCSPSFESHKLFQGFARKSNLPWMTYMALCKCILSPGENVCNQMNFIKQYRTKIV